MTGAEDTARIVRAVSHPAIRMQLDTGALTINGEDSEVVLMHHAELIGHVHASEPELAPLGDANTAHAAMAAAVAKWLPTHIVSIEMLATRNEPHPVAIERALGVAIRHYRPQTGLEGVA
jgi:sugar phosphate isomerase/epimerase